MGRRFIRLPAFGQLFPSLSGHSGPGLRQQSVRFPPGAVPDLPGFFTGVLLDFCDSFLGLPQCFGFHLLGVLLRFLYGIQNRHGFTTLFIGLSPTPHKRLLSCVCFYFTKIRRLIQ